MLRTSVYVCAKSRSGWNLHPPPPPPPEMWYGVKRPVGNNNNTFAIAPGLHEISPADGFWHLEEYWETFRTQNLSV